MCDLVMLKVCRYDLVLILECVGKSWYCIFSIHSLTNILILDASGCCNFISRWKELLVFIMWSRRLFFKGNSVKVEPKEVVMVFDGSPNYVEICRKNEERIKFDGPK
jgi:hypothetical protein